MTAARLCFGSYQYGLLAARHIRQSFGAVYRSKSSGLQPLKQQAICCLSGNPFAHPHRPIVLFVANKGITAIRQGGHKTVEPLFSLRFDLQSRCFFLGCPIAKFTLWLLARLDLPLADC
jgi:hypothetical protein